jgi:hypothetical protein
VRENWFCVSLIPSHAARGGRWCQTANRVRFRGGGAGGGNRAGVFIAQGARSWRRTEGAEPGKTTYLHCSRASGASSASLPDLKRALLTFSRRHAHPRAEPVRERNRCNLEPVNPETRKITLYLVLAQGRLTLQVVCLGVAHFRLPIRPPKSPSRPTCENPASPCGGGLGGGSCQTRTWRFTPPVHQEDWITRARLASGLPTRRSQATRRGEPHPVETWHSHEPAPSRTKCR